MPSRVPTVGTCKHCFRKVGYDSSGVLVHVVHERVTCGGNSGGKKAELR